MRKLPKGDRLLKEGKDITEVVRHLEIAESTWNRSRAQYGGMNAGDMSRRGHRPQAWRRPLLALTLC